MKLQRIKKFIFRRYESKRYKIEVYSYLATNVIKLYAIEYLDQSDPVTLLYLFDNPNECLECWRSLVKKCEEYKLC